MSPRKVSVAGVGLSNIGRVPDKTATQLIWQGARQALADCGLSKDDVDGFGAHGITLAPVEISEATFADQHSGQKPLG
jgi:acetyl-CoA acetyltransferase